MSTDLHNHPAENPESLLEQATVSAADMKALRGASAPARYVVKELTTALARHLLELHEEKANLREELSAEADVVSTWQAIADKPQCSKGLPLLTNRGGNHGWQQ